jgi:hemoglobin/transferrin/lactoferrin receptor protein
MFLRLFFGSILALSSNGFAQKESSDSIRPDNSVFEMDAVDVSPEEDEPGRSFIGRSFDQEISAKSLKKNQANTVGELIEQIPGADNIGGPRKEAQGISIRGFQSRQVLMLLDGTRSNFSMTHNSVVPVRTHLLKKVDVIKGGASSRFGNGALGGLLSFTTLEAHDLIRGSSDSAIELRSMYSDVAAMNQSSLTAAQLFGSKNRGGLIIDATESHAKDMLLSDQKALAYSGYDDASIWAKGNWRAKGGHSFWFSAEDQRKTSLTPFNPTLDESDPSQISDQVEDYQAFKLQYKNQSRDRFRPEVLVYQSATEMTRERLTDRRKDLREVETLGLSLHSTVEVKRAGEASPWSFSLQPGIELVRDDNRGSRDGGLLSNFPGGRSDSVGAYLLTDLTWGEKVWSQAGIRYDEMTLSSNNGQFESRANKQWSPEIEVGYQLSPQWRASASYEEGYNAPKIQEIYVDGFHFPTPFGQNNFIPNPDLQPEDSKAYEVKVGYDYGSEQLGGSFEWAEYQSTIDNYIDQDIDLIGGTTQFVNQAQVEMQGREWIWSQRLDEHDLAMSYSRVRSIKSSNGQPLSTAPADQLRMAYGFERSKFLWGVENILLFTQDRIDKTVLDSQEATPGSSYQNALIGYRFESKDFAGATRLKVNNVFDREYQRHGTPLKGPGRDVRLELQISL